jgi:predicted glycosyltransferase
MRIWIDLANSPHPLLFRPVASRLEELGHTVHLTARDNAQTVELAREWWATVDVIGGASPRGRTSKIRALYHRIEALRRWARARRPDVALSHNSYAQIVAARLARVPVATAMDYEHQPANHLAFRLAHAVLLPEALRGSRVGRQGATESKVHWYPGLKEELYLGDFEPDGGIVERLGIVRAPGSVLVVARTPPSGASYHRADNPLFLAVLQALAARPEVQCVVLARRADQRTAVDALDLPRCVVPDAAVDSRSLMYAADAVIGAGGTMTREAALLGVPTFSLFMGPPARLDLWLEREGLVKRVTDPMQLAGVSVRTCEPRPVQELRERSRSVVDLFVRTTLETAQRM